MNRRIVAQPLTGAAFAPFGDVIDKSTHHERIPINAGRARRLATLGQAVAIGEGARVVISLVEADPYSCPLRLEMVERHPFGSQAFVPLSAAPFLVIVCEDHHGTPGTPQAFITSSYQGINYYPNIWHGVLTPLNAPQDFIVVDRAGNGINLEEYRFPTPFIVRLADPSADSGQRDLG